MIDINNETLIPLNQVPRRVPPRANGKRVHISAVYRWTSRGVRGVILEAIKIGGTTYTSAEALQRFGDRLANGSPGPSETDLATPRTRQREIERAARMLQKELGPRSRIPLDSVPRSDAM